MQLFVSTMSIKDWRPLNSFLASINLQPSCSRNHILSLSPPNLSQPSALQEQPHFLHSNLSSEIHLLNHSIFLFIFSAFGTFAFHYFVCHGVSNESDNKTLKLSLKIM